MTVQEIDKITISRIDNAYIAQVKNDSIVTPNTDNDILKVPKEHWEDIKALFSKEEGEDALPPHQEQDYKIKLESDTKPIKQPIYPLSPEKLEALRTYLNENRRKGFIQES